MKNNLPVTIQSLNQLPRINDLRFSADGHFLVWSQSKGTQGVLYARTLRGEPFKISGNLNVRGGIGYGGGEFGLRANMAIFTEKSGSLYKTRIIKQANPFRISPAWGSCGSPVISPDGKWALYVFQDGEINGLAVTHTHGITWPSQLAMGADFYMQPCWHPSGEKIAWAEWDHPSMPWDSSRIKIGELGGMQLRLFEEHWIAGGEGYSASQPYYSPDGKWLSYIIRDGDWDNLMLYHLKMRTHKAVVKGNGFHLRLPEWIQGMRSYAWHYSSRQILYTRYSHGQATLWRVDVIKGKSEQIDTGGIRWITQLDASPFNDDIVFLGSSPKIPKQICLIRSGKLRYRQSVLEQELGDMAVEPEEFEFPSGGGQVAYGYLYLPQNGSQAPFPLVLHIHGGPTSSSPQLFSGDAAWFTSRGYAYAQLNYRGSSGYGYAYQNALKHQWGIVDVEDAYYLVKYLIDKGLAQSKKIAVMGTSAGGYSVLRALIAYPGFFKAGICSYGVSDLLSDAKNTHKFEKYYHRFLTGDLARNKKRFIDRSPINRIDEIKDPLALFHGDEDRVVSLSQTLEIYEKLKANRTPCTLTVYEGEGHGFRNPENIEDYYEKIQSFLKKYLK